MLQKIAISVFWDGAHFRRNFFCFCFNFKKHFFLKFLIILKFQFFSLPEKDRTLHEGGNLVPVLTAQKDAFLLTVSGRLEEDNDEASNGDEHVHDTHKVYVRRRTNVVVAPRADLTFISTFSVSGFITIPFTIWSIFSCDLWPVVEWELLNYFLVVE